MKLLFIKWLSISLLVLISLPFATASEHFKVFGLTEQGSNGIAQEQPALLPSSKVTRAYETVHILSYVLPDIPEGNPISCQIVEAMSSLLTIRSAHNLRALTKTERAINIASTIQIALSLFSRTQEQFTIAYWVSHFTKQHAKDVLTPCVQQTIHTRATAAAIGIALCHDDHIHDNLLKTIAQESSMTTPMFTNFLEEIAQVTGKRVIIPEGLKLSKKPGGDIALVNLGIHYEEGLLIPQDYEQALYYYEQAKQMGNKVAPSKIAAMAMKEGKIDKAKKLYEDVAEKGDPYADFWLGVLDGTESAYREASGKYTEAEEVTEEGYVFLTQRDPDAIAPLALMAPKKGDIAKGEKEEDRSLHQQALSNPQENYWIKYGVTGGKFIVDLFIRQAAAVLVKRVVDSLF